MTGKELKSLVDAGITPVIEFTDAVEEFELRYEKGMKAYVTKVSAPDEDEIEILAEEKDFSKYNKTLEKPIWRKEYNGEYIYKFSELPDKKFNGSETIYDMLNEDTYNFVVLEDDKRINLFKQYQSENINISYVQWLENKVLEDD
jgi:hypothetical protein